MTENKNMIKNKNMMKNKNMYVPYFMNSKFSTVSLLQADRKKLLDELEDIKTSRKALEYDLSLIGDSVKAASKISSGQTPSQNEGKALEELKNEYSSFFESDDEQEQEEEKQSLLNKVMGVKSYLKKEIFSTKKNIDRFESKLFPPKWDSLIQNKKSTIETGESSKRPLEEIIEETSKKAKVEKEDFSSARKTPSEFIDSLPYNPFDDIGTD